MCIRLCSSSFVFIAGVLVTSGLAAGCSSNSTAAVSPPRSPSAAETRTDWGWMWERRDARVPEDAFAVGTFNLDWAFDDHEERRTKWARPHIAPDEDAWEWKRDRIVDVLLAQKLDIVVLTELGGPRELYDIVSSMSADLNASNYEYAMVGTGDMVFGKHVAVLSRFPLKNERRTGSFAPMHMAVDVELPTGDEITVLAMHLAEGQNKGAVERRMKMARSLKRRASRVAEHKPVLMLGTLGDSTLPETNNYYDSAAGVFSGQTSSRPGDDCRDSGLDVMARRTAVNDNGAVDRIFSCGLEMRAAETSGDDLIVRQQQDPSNLPWTSVPVDSAPHRDVSDHLVVWAEIVLPERDLEMDEGDLILE